jgi:hypothetical protein
LAVWSASKGLSLIFIEVSDLFEISHLTVLVVPVLTKPKFING